MLSPFNVTSSFERAIYASSSLSVLVAGDGRRPMYQNVAWLLVAGATAGVLAMHYVSRAREKFQPGAACGL